MDYSLLSRFEKHIFKQSQPIQGTSIKLAVPLHQIKEVLHKNSVYFINTIYVI